MPAFNEESYVGSVVLMARQHADEILIVDDGSKDRTAVVGRLAGATVVSHSTNLGYGKTIQDIFSEARKRDIDVLVILDADGQHDSAEIPRLVEAVNAGNDVVIGSREMKNNVIPAYRRIGQRFLSAMTRVASKEKLSDTESGFRAYSRKAVKELRLKEDGMSVSSEIVSAAAGKGLTIAEVPISVTYTRDGSTLNPIRHGVGVFNRIMVMISERRPLLAFGIAGLLFILLGVFFGVYVITTLYGNQILQLGSALLSMLFVTIGVLVASTGIILSVLVKRLSGSIK
jgi:glycosyltransferase involved in cell wall biosynthesis